MAWFRDHSRRNKERDDRLEESTRRLIDAACSTTTVANDIADILHKHIEHLKLFEGNGFDMIVVFNVRFVIVHLNRAFAIAYGHDPEKLVGRDIRDILFETERDDLIRNISLVTKAEASRRITRVIEHSGTLRRHDWVDTGIFDQGQLVAYHRIGRDLNTTVDLD